VVIFAQVTAPVLIACLALLDGNFLDRNLAWSPVPPYLYLGQLGATAALAGMVAKAKEDQ
jgi:hypothetical protein